MRWTSPTFSYRKRFGEKMAWPPSQRSRNSSRLCTAEKRLKYTNDGSTESIARGIGSFSSTKLWIEADRMPRTYDKQSFVSKMLNGSCCHVKQGLIGCDAWLIRSSSSLSSGSRKGDSLQHYQNVWPSWTKGITKCSV